MALLPNYRDIMELIKKGSTLEAQEKIIALREGAIELQEENLALKERIKELEALLKQKSEIVWEEPLYWKNDGETKDGPYCQKCYDTQEKLIRLQNIEQGHWHCKACNNSYYDNSYSSSGISIGVVKSGIDWDAY